MAGALFSAFSSIGDEVREKFRERRKEIKWEREMLRGFYVHA